MATSSYSEVVVSILINHEDLEHPQRMEEALLTLLTPAEGVEKVLIKSRHLTEKTVHKKYYGSEDTDEESSGS